MVTILVEERLTTSVYAPGAWQYGPLVAGGATGLKTAAAPKAK
jgi:hypothetical protein